MHDDDAVGHLGDHAHVVRDQDDGGAELALQAADQLQDLRLHCHVEGGGRLVGDQHFRPAGERHGDHDALAHAARQLVRILLQPALGLGDAHGGQRLDRRGAGRGRADVAVRADRLGELAADRQDRVQRRHRLLKDHGDVAAAHPAHGGFGKRRELAPVEADRAAGDARIRLGKEAHDGERRHRLAGAGFARDAERLAGGEVEGEVVDDDARAFRRGDFGHQVADGEDGLSLSLPPCGGGPGRGDRDGADGFEDILISWEGGTFPLPRLD